MFKAEAQQPGTGGEEGDGDQPTEDAQADLARALADAEAAYEAGQQALQAGDFAAYGTAQNQLKAALDRAAEAQRRLAGETADEPADSDQGASEAPSDEGSASAPPADDGATPAVGESPST